MPRAVYILMACIALIGSNGLILSPVLSDISGEFGDSIATVGRAIAAYGAGTATTAILFGRSIDRFGSAKALQIAMVAGGIAQILSSQSTGWGSLSVTQAITGAAAGIALPAIYAITADISEKGAEAKTMGVVIFGWSLSLVFAIPLGAALADFLGWRMMLVAIGILCIATLPATLRFENSKPPATDQKPLGRFAPLFLPGGATAYLVCGLFMVSFYGAYAYSGAHVIASFGQSTAAAGLIALCYGIGFGISSAFSKYIDRIGATRLRPWAFLIAALVFSGMGLANTFPLFLLAIGLWGLINNVLLNTIVVGLTALAPHSKGAVLGLYSFVTYMAASVGSFGLGELFEAKTYFAVALAAVAMHLLAALLTLRAARR